MKPDSYMPYYGNDFDGATKGLRREVKFSYLSACWHYWYQTHCSGLPNDDEYLRLVCECSETDWARTRGMIFGPLFTLSDDGRWHQKRTRELYDEAVFAYEKRVANAKAARDAKVNIKVDSNVNPKVDSNPRTGLQPESEPKPDPDPESEPEPEPVKLHINKRGLPPSLQQVKDKAEFIGLSPEEAEAFWNHFESVGWIDKNGHEIVKWESKLATWKTQSQASRFGHNGGKPDSAQFITHSKELDRVLDQLRKLKDGASCDAMGKRYYTPADKKRLDMLISRRDLLRKELNVVA